MIWRLMFILLRKLPTFLGSVSVVVEQKQPHELVDPRAHGKPYDQSDDAKNGRSDPNQINQVFRC